MRLTRRFFRRDPITLAKALLGQVLMRVLDDGTRLSGRIVEVEAYLGVEDRAAHSYGGRRTARNRSMYLDGGHAYVYFTYGMHWCVNIVADTAEVPTACLIRALEPLEGIETMKALRAGKVAVGRLRLSDLCSGPAKLTQALQIDRRLDGLDLTTDPRLFLERGRTVRPSQLVVSPRIGVDYAGDWARRSLRFYIAGHAHVSLRRPGR